MLSCYSPQQGVTRRRERKGEGEGRNERKSRRRDECVFSCKGMKVLLPSPLSSPTVFLRERKDAGCKGRGSKERGLSGMRGVGQGRKSSEGRERE